MKMKKTIKKDVREFLKELSEDERMKVRDEFLKASGLAYPSWYNKFSGKVKFSRLELVTLGNICKMNFLDD